MFIYANISFQSGENLIFSEFIGSACYSDKIVEILSYPCSNISIRSVLVCRFYCEVIYYVNFALEYKTLIFKKIKGFAFVGYKKSSCAHIKYDIIFTTGYFSRKSVL